MNNGMHIPDGTRVVLIQEFSEQSFFYPAQSEGRKVGNGADNWQIRMDRDDKLITIPKTHLIRVLQESHPLAVSDTD